MDNCGVIKIHPENSRYFIYKGKAVVLITATEHYGSVTNAAFNYIEYLDMLQSYGFNLSRLVILLRETESEFKGYLGYQNTLCPTAENYICPWSRSPIPGALDGGNKFDLESWNEAFFDRLKNFCMEAEKRGIIVEITFFSQYYSNKPDSPWSLSVLNPDNNINDIGATGYNRFTTCENAMLLAKQEALVRKIVTEMKDFDNIYYEICNEPPYPQSSDPELMPEDYPHVLGEKAISEWQNYIASVIHNAEEKYEKKHMVAVCDHHENINTGLFNIYNYHFREFADKGLQNHAGHGKAMALDETLTGIVSWNRELDFDARRKEAWELFMCGFSVYDYLDFTIATDDPKGEGNVQFPGGYYYDGTVMKLYLKHLKCFMEGLDFVYLAPDHTFVKDISSTARAFSLVGKGKTYAVYINGSGLKRIPVELPEGMYRAEWFNPVTGNIDKTQENIKGGNTVLLEMPVYLTDIAIKISAMES